MHTINDMYVQSELALAAYADLIAGISGQDYLIALQQGGNGMSQTQAEAFASSWSVVAQHTDTSNGLSATVFEEVATGQRYLAVRGTEGFTDPKDLWTDIRDIGVLGTPERQAQYAGLRDQVAGWLSDGTLSPGFTVTGHSLGGFLAGALLVDYPTEISHAYLYNAPGIGGLSAGLRLLAGLESEPDLDLSKVSNLISQAGFSLVAGLGLDWSAPVPVFIEDQSPTLTGNHSIVPLTDALAVYNLLGGVGSSLTVDQIGSIIRAGSNRPEDSLEAIVNALGDLFGVGAKVTTTSRDELYTRIKAIQDELPLYPNIGLTSLHDDAPEAIATAARAENGFLYALEHLNPFAVVGDDFLYTDLDASNYSDLYLLDRGSLLQDKLLRGLSDYPVSDFGPHPFGTGPYAGRPVHYVDIASGYDVDVSGNAGIGTTIIFDSNEDSAGPIQGTSFVDHLYGRGGNDALEGKGGDDYLEGGAGNDTYVFNTGDGSDTIYDVSGSDQIQVKSGGGTSTLGGVIDSAPGQQNLYKDSDSNRYAKSGNDLVIDLAVGGKITIRNFTDGMFGINLNPTAAAASPQAPTGTQFFDLGQPAETEYVVSPTVNGPVEHPVYGLGPWGPYLTEIITAQGAAGPMLNSTGNVITGQVAGGLGDSYIQGDAGFNHLIDDLWYSAGSLTGTPVEWLSGDPVFDPLLQSGIFFSLGQGAGNDVLRGGGGNDWLESHGGDDWLYGEDGNDLLLDNPGLDFGDNRWLALPGSSSNDHLSGGNGDDVLISLQGKDTLDGGADNDVLLSGQGDDTLSGGTGNDWLLADAALSRHDLVLQPDGSYKTVIEAAEEEVDYGKDTLFGDAGDDILAGGGGDDFLLGGSENDTLWGDGRSVLDENGAIQISVGDGAIAGNDTLFGEQGDDVLLGGSGDDYLDGGEGNDQLEGDHADLDSAYHGNDHLFGGAGNDTLVGNGGDDQLSGDAGNDQLWGGEGNDTLFGGDGIDTLTGGAGNDAISGGTGDDVLIGGAGNDGLFGDDGADRFDGGDGDDILSGGSGDDELYGSAGNDTLEGGSGIDSLFGGAGDDIYVINPGIGQDVIVDTQGRNSIAFGGGVTASSLTLQEVQANDGAYYLAIAYGSSGDRVFIKNGPLGAISSFGFADGSVLSFAELMAQSGLSLNGTGSDGDDILQGGNAVDLMLGGAGNDEIHGGDGADELLGGTGDDVLNGDAGDDFLNGGAGNDELRGGAGSDTYLVHWGMGQDTLIEAGGETSVLQLDAGISLSDLTMSRDGNDLVVQFKGIDDGARIKNFAASSQVWELRTEDGASAVIDDALIDGAGVGVIDGAAAAIERYEAGVEVIYYATLAPDSVRGTDGVFRKTTSRATNFGATTDYYSVAFARNEQISDGASIARLSTPYTATSLLIDQETISTAALNVGVGETSLDTSGAVFSPLTGSATALPAGATLVNAFGRPQDLEGDLSLDYGGGNTQPIGYWTFPHGTGGARFAGLQFKQIQHYTYQRESLLTLEQITAGASNNVIETAMHSSVVDGGGGDDVISVRNSYQWDTNYSTDFRAVPYRYDAPFNPRNLGVLLYGNTGNDELVGGSANDVLIGGEGDDYMDGVSGEDTYLVTADDTGWDIIADTGSMAEHPETFWTRYQDWYYHSLGINDWQAREENDESLPPLPAVSINDYASIAQLVAEGVIETDTVEFGDGISLSDLTVSWGEYVPHLDPEDTEKLGRTSGDRGWMDAGSSHATMDISWAGGSGIRVLMPHASPRNNGIDPGVLSYAPNLDRARFDRFLGTGIEQFKFSDGTVISMQDMLALAPPPTLDPHELDNVLEGAATADVLFGAKGDDVIRGGAGSDAYVFNLGDGVDTIEDAMSSGDVNSIRFGFGIAPSDLNIQWTTDSLTIEVGAGGDAIVLVNSDAADSDPSKVIDTLIFTVVDGYGGVDTIGMPLIDLLPPPADVPGEQIVGTSAYDTLVGTAGNDTIEGLAGNDTVFAGDGNDTIVGGAGRDNLYGEGGDDVFLVDGTDRAYDIFNGGEGIDTILGGAGDDNVRLRRFDASNSVELIDGGAGLNVIAGTRGYDMIDLSATTVTKIERIDAGAGNDTVTGTDNADVITGGAGRDVLNGGGGDDTFMVDGTNRAYDIFNGDAGFDTILGGAGDDTVRLRRFGASNSVELIDGGAGLNVIAGTRGYDTIDLSATTVSNIERIDAGAGNDTVTGTGGRDVILGGAGRDVLNGGLGNDLYLFNRKDGRDRVVDLDANPNNDVIQWDSSVRHDQLWFSRLGDDLSIGVIGTRDEVAIENWYLGSDHQIEALLSGDGFTLVNTQVDQLVQAMAAFSAPAGGELNLSPQLHAQLESVLAANWQAA